MYQPKTTIVNPLMLADFPDPSVLFYEGAYYMSTTSMHFMPGIPIMRSVDLCHWEIISYVYDTFSDSPAHCLSAGKHIYGQGSWATCFRYHHGYFYICFNSNDLEATFVYRTTDIVHGSWERAVFPEMHHDPSLLFDDDGCTYLIYGNGTIYLRQLQPDAMGLVPEKAPQILIDTPQVPGLNCEGSHIHKINGWYYVFLIQWPKTGTQRRIQWCYRSQTLHGSYVGKIILDDDMGYQNNGVAQGGIFCGSQQDWYMMLFQDRSAVGRCPVLLPVTWEDNWPVLGTRGQVLPTFNVPYKEKITPYFTASDSFEYHENKLALCWQWNHNPDNKGWSLLERPGYLRLRTTTLAPCFVFARNTLTQHTVAPRCSFTTKLYTSEMLPGDFAGLGTLQFDFGAIGIYNEGSIQSLQFRTGHGEMEEIQKSLPYNCDHIYLSIHFDFTDGIDRAYFSYSLDNKLWVTLDNVLPMHYSLKHFTGYRIALFYYATENVGGTVDIDYIHFDHR